jgi:hypothetical protein
MLIVERRMSALCRDGLGSDAHAEGDDSVEGLAVAEPIAAEPDGVPFAVVVARVLAHVAVQPLVQRDERSRCLGHDRRLDGDRSSMPVEVRIHRGDGQARTLLVELRPVLALGACELALDPPPPVLGAVRQVLSRLGVLHHSAEQLLLLIAISHFLCALLLLLSTVVVWWCDILARFFSKSPQNFSNSRNVLLDFQFYPNFRWIVLCNLRSKGACFGTGHSLR